MPSLGADPTRTRTSPTPQHVLGEAGHVRGPYRRTREGVERAHEDLRAANTEFVWWCWRGRGGCRPAPPRAPQNKNAFFLHPLSRIHRAPFDGPSLVHSDSGSGRWLLKPGRRVELEAAPAHRGKKKNTFLPLDSSRRAVSGSDAACPRSPIARYVHQPRGGENGARPARFQKIWPGET